MTQQQQTELSKYRILSLLGVGFFGKVFYAKRISDDADVCIKEIDTSMTQIPPNPPPQREVDVWGQLNHPYVIKFFSSFEENGYFYIIMEYVSGGDLRKNLLLAKKVIPEKIVCLLFCQMAFALDYFKKNNIIHRDLKPDNILLTSKLCVKMCDFGVSTQVEDGSGAKTAIGTFFYMPPEMIQQQIYHFQADVWSLGCILYEVMTFNHPFGLEQFTFFQNIMNREAPPITQNYSKELKALVQKMLTKDPKQRITIEEILQSSFLNPHLIQCALDLGSNYENGSSCDKDPYLAFQYYKFAAMKQSLLGYAHFGRCYYYQIGVKENKAVGRKYIKRAADGNCTFAQQLLLSLPSED